MRIQGELNQLLCTSGLKNAVNSHDTYKRAQYTAVEAHADVAYLHQRNPQMPAGDMFSEKLVSANQGAPAEIGIAARLDRGGEPVVHLGPDSDPASPFFSQAGNPTGVDALTQSHMYNVALNSDRLEGKFQDASGLATRIKNALNARANAGLPNTMRYKFAYAEEGAWKPVIPGNPPQLAEFVQEVNGALTARGAAAADLLKAEDFVLVNLAP